MNGDPEQLKREILRLTREYSRLVHRGNRPGIDAFRAGFVPGTTVVPYAGRVFTEDEVEAAVGATLDFWLTLGPEGEAFERELADCLGVRQSLLVNSGSSANLVALSALTSHKISPNRRLTRGDEVVTVAAGFPTTVAPIVQVGCVPVFIDSHPLTGNVAVNQLEAAYSPDKTKAVILAHTLGNPFDLGAVLDFCRRRNLWLIEDNCDALGCTYSMPLERALRLGLDHLIAIARQGNHPTVRIESQSQNSSSVEILTAPTGSWGDLSTQSFYPPHHLTTGEGGAVNIVSRASLRTYAESFRDWGRDCWCASGKDNTCGKRFGWRLGELPAGYDHKYIYSHLGFNLKPLDVQAAIGRQQLRKLPDFIKARKQNWEYLRRGLADCEEFFEYSLPTHARSWRPESGGFDWDGSGCSADPSWFGFMLRIRPEAPFTHTDLARHLDEQKVGNRMLFGGNLVRQPAFVELQKSYPNGFRVSGTLAGAEALMRTALFLGTFPGLTTGMLDYEIEVIRKFVSSQS